MTLTSRILPERRLAEHVKVGIRSTLGEQVLATGEPADPDDTYTVCVGQMIQHLAVSNVPILSVQWVVGGSGVANYTLTPNAGTVTPITSDMLVQNPLTFAFTSADDWTVGVYITTAYGTAYVTNDFVVTAPQVNFLDSMTQQVYVGAYAGGTYLRFGDPDDPTVPGIVINAVLFGAQNVPGWVGILQLATNQRFGTDDEGRPWHWSLNGQAVLDVGPGGAYMFYQNQIEVLAPGANAQFDITDAPALELGPPFQFVAVGDGDPIVPETYESYLMFIPVGPGSIWVPLSVLTWSWEGYSQFENGTWGPVRQPNNAVNPLGVLTDVFPTWTTNTNAGQWVAGMTRPARTKRASR